jgi:hypothetical protein
MKSKWQYGCLVLITIVLGLLSRSVSGMPYFCGDVLYAMMIYWVIRSLFRNFSLRFSFLACVLFCFFIEFAQALQNPWLVSWRVHKFGKLILGQGFLWSDLIAYLIGAFAAIAVDKFLLFKFCKK